MRMILSNPFSTLGTTISQIPRPPWCNGYDHAIENHDKETFVWVKVKVKVKLRFSAPSAGIAEIEQT